MALKLKRFPRPTLKARVLVTFPARVVGTDGINVTKANGTYRFSLDTSTSSIVTGPGASTDNAVPRYDGTDGTVLQNSLVTISDDGEMSVPALANVQDIDAATRATIFAPYVYQIIALDDDGDSDQSAAIQVQIDYCKAQGICEAVFPPYLIWAEGLVISHPLLLRGTRVQLAEGNSDEGSPSQYGTRIIAKDGTNPCIEVIAGANGAAISGIQFLQVHDPDAPGFTPTVYAPAIRNYSGWTVIENNSFWGCYDGVRLGKTWNDPGSAYVTIRNNTFACFHRGIHVYKSGDWNNIHGNWFQNFFVEDLTNQRQYIQAHAEAMFIERADALAIHDNGVFGHLYGIRTGINANAPTEAEGIAERLKLSNNDFDKVRVGIYLVKGCTGGAVNTAIVGDNVAGSFAIQGNENVKFHFTNTRTINHGVQAILAAETGCVLEFKNLTVINAGQDAVTTVFSCAAGATIIRDAGFTATGTYSGIEGGAGTYITGATLAGTETLTNKTLNNPAITGGGSLSGTFSNNPTFSGTVTFSGILRVGASDPFSDAAGTLTLQNVDALDATTESTIEAAIDTLANLTSVQGHTITLTGAFIRSGAHSLTITTTGATSVTFPTSGTLTTEATGSWTPTDASGAGLSFSSVSAGYTKIGNMVFAYATLTYPATADGTAASIAGLPFNVGISSYARQCHLTTSTEATLAGMIPTAGAATISLRTSASGVVTNATMSGDTIFFTAIYPVS